MNQSQLRRAIRQMIKGKTSSQPAPLGTTNLDKAFINSFNQEAQAIFKKQAGGLLHQWNEALDDRAYLHGAIELLALLDIKSAEDNPADQFWVRTCAPVRFFGVTCEAKDVIPGINKMIAAVNDMAKNKWLKASLYNLGMLELASDPLTPSTKKFCIFSYIVVDPKFDVDATTAYGDIEFKEGGMPPEYK